ncbi:MAG: hypothetical protein AAB367_00425 [Patescibacteria group bacterium]
MKTKKPCSSYGYHSIRVISTKRIAREKQSTIPGLGALALSWTEVRTRHRCRTCRRQRTIITRENYRQQHSPPPT